MSKIAAEEAVRRGHPAGLTRKGPDMTVPSVEEDGLVLRGFTVGVLSVGKKGEEPIAEVTAGAGVGGDYVVLSVGKHRRTIWLRDLLRAYAQELDASEVVGAIKGNPTEDAVDDTCTDCGARLPSPEATRVVFNDVEDTRRNVCESCAAEYDEEASL